MVAFGNRVPSRCPMSTGMTSSRVPWTMSTGNFNAGALAALSNGSLTSRLAGSHEKTRAPMSTMEV